MNVEQFFFMFAQVDLTLGMLYVRSTKARYRDALRRRLLEVSEQKGLGEILRNSSKSMHLLKNRRYANSWHFVMSWLPIIPTEKLGSIGVQVEDLPVESQDDDDEPASGWMKVHNFYQANHDEKCVYVFSMGLPLAMSWTYAAIIWFQIYWLAEPHSTWLLVTGFLLLGVGQVLPLFLHCLGVYLVSAVGKKFAICLENVAMELRKEDVKSIRSD